MTPPPLAWTLMVVSLWTAASAQVLLQEPLRVLYLEVSAAASVDCGCVNGSCDTVYWFHSDPGSGAARFIGRHNNADRTNHGAGVDEARFTFRKIGPTFQLRINTVREDDGGIYSCVLEKKTSSFWRPGALLRPGETAPKPTQKTTPKLPNKSGCHCPKKKSSQAGSCSPLVLWSLSGLAAGLALAILCTLCYFSRLPKKCRHRFVKGRAASLTRRPAH